ncbi:MAG: flavodoxin family protein [Thaumarchaeota archaeon]|jgi:multimeric flavodoxin WrbA|nr:flavodoxin family protein [Nitrososphaerota archaeon]
MRVLAVNGSPHKEGICKKILNRIIKGVEDKGGSVELVDLSSKTLQPCLACAKAECWESMKCIVVDDGLELRRLFNECDALVFAAPVYFLSVNGLAKNFIDRMRNYREDARPSVAVAVAGGTGKGCVTALQEICRWMMLVGFNPVVAEPVTRYNLDIVMEWARHWGEMLVEKTLSVGRSDLYTRLLEYGRLPYMGYTLTDEILYLARSALEALLRKGAADQTVELARLVEEAEAKLRLGCSEEGLRLAVEAHEKSMRLFNKLY